jgi:CubicO group peptidase (beta-lactamase class C family)
MNETVTRTADAEARGNVASAHARIDDTVRVITRYDIDNVRPAGSMYSSIIDMTRWLRFLLDSARVGGTRLVSDTGFAQLFHPQVLVSADEFYPTAELTHPRFTAYGMGWFLEDYRGAFVAFHTGSIDGMSAIVGLLPEQRAGVVIFANLDHAELRHALMYRAFDLVLGGVGRDWSGEMRTLYRDRTERARSVQRKVEDARVSGTSPSLALEQYAGSYSDSLYGSVSVALVNGSLVATISPYLTADLEHWNYDTFRAVWRNRWLGKNLFSFRLGTDGKVTQLDLGGGQVYTRSGSGSQ